MIHMQLISWVLERYCEKRKTRHFFAITHSACLSLPNLTNYYNPEKITDLLRDDCTNLHKNIKNIIEENNKDLVVVFYNTWFKKLWKITKIITMNYISIMMLIILLKL